MKVKTNVKAGVDFEVTSTSSVKGVGLTTGSVTSEFTVKSSLVITK